MKTQTFAAALRKGTCLLALLAAACSARAGLVEAPPPTDLAYVNLVFASGDVVRLKLRSLEVAGFELIVRGHAHRLDLGECSIPYPVSANSVRLHLRDPARSDTFTLTFDVAIPERPGQHRFSAVQLDFVRGRAVELIGPHLQANGNWDTRAMCPAVLPDR
jgi:hypothetical protein